MKKDLEPNDEFFSKPDEGASDVQENKNNLASDREANREANEEINEETRTGENKKSSVFRRRFGAIGLAAVTFLAGYLASDLQYDSELRALKRVKQAIQKHYYEEVADEDFYGVLFDAINYDLLDSYSGYMNPDEYQSVLTEATGEWSGLGITFITENAEGEKQMLVQRVAGNSPAESVGVAEGDFVIGYGVSEDGLTLSEDYETFYAFVQEREKDEPFFLKINRDGVELTLEIAKKTFVENYVFYRSSTTAYAFTGKQGTTLVERGDTLPALSENAAYIRLVQFNGNAAKEFAAAMEKFKQEGKTDLVLDLRSNGGGYMNILQEIASYFCKGEKKSALIATAKYREGQTESFYSTGAKYSEYFSEQSKIKVLADSSTASASECLIGCMIDYGAIEYSDIALSERAGVAKTYGKGIMQSTYPFGLFGKVDAIKLTTAKIIWPKSETCIHGRGILPEDGAKTVSEGYGKDVEINAALEKLFA